MRAIGQYHRGNYPVVLVNTPELVRGLLIDGAADLTKGNLAHSAFRALLGESISMSEGDRHHRLHCLLAPLFSRRHIARYAHRIVRVADTICGGWADHADVDLFADLHRLTMHTSATSSSRSPHCRPKPGSSGLQPSTEPVWSDTMRTGEVMHIPRGWWHQATRTGKGAGFSLHTTFGLTRRTGVDWLAWVACVTDFSPQLETSDGKAVILAAGKKITVPADALPVLRPLLSGQPVSVHEITTATGVDAGALAEALIAAGICAELTPDLAEGYAGMLTPKPA